MIRSTIALALALSCTLATAVLAIEDGTLEVGPPDQIAAGHDSGPIYQSSSLVVLNPIESVSISASQVWQDNRHRAYYEQNLGNVNGFLLFNVSSIPDGSVITSMRLLCYLEDAFGSPNSNPTVDVYYSADDNWTRGTATPGSLSLDVLLLGGTAFSTYVPTHTFVLNVNAHNWAADLTDNRVTIGFRNSNNFYSYIYFYGAGGDPVGPPPELTIEYQQATPVEAVTWGGIKAHFE
jgi:hypothetical protein